MNSGIKMRDLLKAKSRGDSDTKPAGLRQSKANNYKPAEEKEQGYSAETIEVNGE
ncbi:MAG: hypothetical protein QM802_04575 [Agriterribacter sp.]